MKGKMLWLMVSCLVVAGLVLAACAPAAKPAPAPTPAPTPAPKPAPKPTPAEKEAVAPAVKEPQYGGTLTALHLHGNLEPQTWDPAECNWIVEPFTSPYFENLLVGDLSKGPRGTKQFDFTDAEYIPAEFLRGSLAEKWEMTDPKTIVFHIRKGVMWAERKGVMTARELTAQDVAFTFNRLVASPKSKPSHYFLEGASAPDKYTAVVKLKEYNANWLPMIGYGYYCKIYPEELVKAGIHNWKNAVGTGAFMLKDYVSGASLTFEKNPAYWDKTVIDGKEYQLPFLDRMIWPIIVDESTQLAALRTAKVDKAVNISWKYKDSLQETNPELIRWRILSAGFPAIALRVDKKPFDDVRVRRALSMAIDRDAYIKTQLGGDGFILGGPFSPRWGEQLYTPLEKLPPSAQELFQFNPQKAKQLLTEAGLPKGFKAEMVTMTFTTTLDICSMVVAFWKDIGAEVELKPLEYATYLAVQYGKTHKHMMYYSKGHGQPTRLMQLIGTPGQYWNPTEFNDPKFNDMANKVVGLADMTEQNRLGKEANIYLIEQCPYVILPTGYYYSYAYPWVKNWWGENNTGCRSFGSSIFATIWLDRELRFKMIGKR